MAKPSSWIRHVEAFVDSSRPSVQLTASIDAVAELVKNDLLTIEALVRELDLYLTTTDHVIRSRGILLLAEILARLSSKTLNHATIHSLIGFFTSRLADWQALHGALVGCLVLLRRKSDVGVVVGSDARELAQSYLQNVQVQSLALHDRKLCFELLECLLAMYPGDVAALGEDLVYGICEGIDEEKDPLCLMLTFHLVGDLARVFPDPHGPVASFAGDLFEILGRYFPVHFTQPSDDFDIQRDDLSKALMHAFCSTPYFEQFAIPLLLDKLSSSRLLAKLDSLKYLANCILCFGADRMANHAKVIWLSLKDIIFTFPQEPLFSLVSRSAKDMDSLENQIGKEALNCLQTATSKLKSLNNDSFASLIVEDEDIEMNILSVAGEKSYESIPIEKWHKLSAVGNILYTAAKVSSSCSNRVFQKFFCQLMDIFGISLSSSSSSCITNDIMFIRRLNFGALYLSIALLSSCRDLAVATQEFSPQSVSVNDEWCCLLQKFAGRFAHALGSLVKSGSSGIIHENTVVGDVYYGVKGLQMLATFPGCSIQLSTAIYEDILMTFMSVITGKSEDTYLWKLALEALVQIASFIEKFHDSEKQICYTNIVVEKIVSFLQVDDSEMSLALKLDAASYIGTTRLDFMLRVIQELEKSMFAKFLEVSVEGKLKTDETLIQLLDFYSSQVLPWCRKTGNFEEVGMHFALYILDQMEINVDFNIGFAGKGVLDATLMTMKLIVSGFREELQALIVQKTCDILSSRKFFPLEELMMLSTSNSENLQLELDLVNLSSRDELFISLFASVLMTLSPETPLPDAKLILKLLLVLLLKGYVPAAQALCSIVNKWPLNNAVTSSAWTLEEVLDVVFEAGLLRVLCNDSFKKCKFLGGGCQCASYSCHHYSQVQMHAMVGLAWLGKGLVMCGHEKVKELTMLLLKCLLSSSDMKVVSLPQDALANGHRLASSAADAFHVLLSDSEVCLNEKFHAVIKPLYKQRFFLSMMPILLSSIKDCTSPITSAILYRAFGHLISATPLPALYTEAKKLIPSLSDALSILSLEQSNRDLVYSLLLVLSGILMDESGKEAITENAHTIIDLLVKLIFYPHMMLVRETAIQCLLATTEIPYARIYPMRPQVLRAVSKALDDPKRPVRLEAVRCRQAWASIASRSLHF